MRAGAAALAMEDSAAEALPREIEAALPRYCAGCGIRLQRDDPDAPGCAQFSLDHRTGKICTPDIPCIQVDEDEPPGF